MTISASSRIKVLDTPVAAPGICSICGSAGDGKRKFIDFGKQLDWYGAVYLCTECIGEVALASGYMSRAKFDELYNEFRKVQIENDQLKAKYKPVEDAILSVVAGPTIESAPAMDSVTILSENTFDEEGDNRQSPEGESETDESPDIEGPDDLFDDSDLEFE